MNNKVICVHHLRGIAALLVVFFHFRSFLDGVYTQNLDLGTKIFGAGAFGVDLFFMISGFIIALATHKPVKSLTFIVRRFFRIYPLFIFIFVIGIFTVYGYHSSNELFRSALFIHNNYSKQSPGFGFNILGPAWTLGYEVYFYFIFMVSMALSHKYRLLISSLLIILPIVILQLIFSSQFSLSADAAVNVNNGLIRFVSSPILVEFVIGMTLYYVYSSGVKIERNYSAIIYYSCLLIFLSMYFLSKTYGFGLTSFGVWSLTLLVGCLTYDKSIGFKSYKALVFLGDISYSLYMSHYLIIKCLEFYRPSWWWDTTGMPKFILASFICLFIATALHYLIEKPFINFGKNLESAFKKQIKNVDQGNVAA
ncbi:acyltransferase [Pantoea sp. GM01]|uniref:acyltransferase family protein n=1 Tax=Pantoea sp. GM01 TaxID=1144320 RepID=UPI000271077E|nr:acyltransferase [Pantoea sp. GM01]EJL90280.1 putative acyltransferase [Pantoea sp. GM01]